MTDIYTSPAGAALVRRRYREALASWPVPAEHRSVPTSQGETFVLTCGPVQAPPVVLLHGSSANALNWFTDVPAWSRALRLHAVDVIGEPGLSARARPPLDSAEHARWLDEVLDALGLHEVALVGESLGGLLAMNHASRRGDRVSRLALLNPAGISAQRWTPVVAAVALHLFGAWGRRRSIELLCGTSDIPEFARLVQRHFRPRMALPVLDESALRALTMPVLAVLGGRDRVFDASWTRTRLAREVPHSDVVTLAEAGHLLPRQNGVVLDFLAAGNRDRS